MTGRTKGRPPSVVALIVGASIVIVAVCALEWTSGAGTTDWPAMGGFALAVVLGEQLRLRPSGRLSTAPLSFAAALAMAMSTADSEPHLTFGAGECVAVVGAAMVLGMLLSRGRHGTSTKELSLDLLIRLAVVALVAVSFRETPVGGGLPLGEVMWTWELEGTPVVGAPRAGVLVGAALAAVALDAALRAVPTAAAEHLPWGQVARDEYRAGYGPASAVAVTAALVALCYPEISVVGLPMTMVPLALTQAALRRQAATRASYGQSIIALSRIPEVVGLIPRGHAAQVASLSVRVGRELGMADREVRSLEFAALLHDIGQVTLRHPIPGGATTQAANADQQRIADHGAEVVRTTDVMEDIALILEKQAVPYHFVVERHERLPLGSRIIKVTNAYADLITGRHTRGDRRSPGAAALERLYLGLGYEYDPEVVDALERLVTREAEAPS